MKAVNYYKTIVISDVPLGTGGSKLKKLIKFIKNYSCERLIFNGDIIKNWGLNDQEIFTEKHFKFFSSILNTIEQNKTEVFFIVGSNDSTTSKKIPLRSKNVSVVKDLTITSGKSRFLILNGDDLDALKHHLDFGRRIELEFNTMLLTINKKYNLFRNKRGLYYKSLLNIPLNKSAVPIIRILKQQIADLIHSRNCDGLICGHIHKPGIIQFAGLQYLNTGFWTEDFSILTENDKGIWALYDYKQYLEEIKEAKIHYKIQKKAFTSNRVENYFQEESRLIK